MHRKDIKYGLLFLILAIAGYWEISMWQFSLRDDMMSVVLPWKYFYGECLQHNIIPLWNPYQQVGYPIHADLQYSLWYPESWITGFFTGYTNITLHLLFTFYIFMAGMGMYRLARFFNLSHRSAFMAGAVFMLSGVFIGHAQSMVSVLGAVWLPWALSEYFRMINGKFNWYAVSRAVFFTFLMVSGGYQAVTIILFYLFILIFLIRTTQHLLIRDYKGLQMLVMKNTAWVAGILLLSTGIIISLYYVLPYVGRLGGVSFREASMFPFSPQSLLSILFPFAVTKEKAFFDTDISITNLYFGVICLIFFITGLGLQKKRLHNTLLYFGLFALLLSFGSYLPLWRWTYTYIPFMNLFKYPSFFRFFTLIAFILTAASAFDHFEIDHDRQRKRFYFLSLIIMVFIIAGTAWAANMTDFGNFSFFRAGIPLIQELSASGIHENIFINGTINLFLLMAIILTALFFRRYFTQMAMLLIILDLVISVQLNMFYTGCNSEDPCQVNNELNNRIRGFPVPMNEAVIQNTGRRFSGTGVSQNTNIFNKSVSFDAFTSFYFRKYQYLRDTVPDIRDSILSNPLLYFSTEGYQRDDTCYITRFEPQHIQARTYTAGQRELHLLQSNYPGWRVYVDGKETRHRTSDYLFISATIPAGEHRVEFIFDLWPVRYGFYISVILFIVLAFYLFYAFLLKNFGSYHYLVFFIVFGLFLIFSAFTFYKNRERRAGCLKNYATVAERFRKDIKAGSSSCIIANIDNPYLFDSLYGHKDVFYTGADESFNNILVDSACKKYDVIYYLRLNRTENAGLLYRIYRQAGKMESLELSNPISRYRFIHGIHTGKGSLVFNDNFETKPLNLEYTGMIDNTTGFSGTHSHRMNEGEHYTAAYKNALAALPFDQPFLIGMGVKLMMEEKTEVYWVATIYGKNKQRHYRSQDLSKNYASPGQWMDAEYACIPFEHGKGDSVLMYLYKPAGKKVWLDDMKIEMTGLNEK